MATWPHRNGHLATCAGPLLMPLLGHDSKRGCCFLSSPPTERSSVLGRKFLVVVVAALTLAMMMATVAFADKPAQDPNCTFEKGNTTCTTTEKTNSYITTKQVGTTYRYCSSYWYGYYKSVPVYQNYQTDVYETTTTVYKGKSDRVESTETTTSEVGPNAVGSQYLGSC